MLGKFSPPLNCVALAKLSNIGACRSEQSSTQVFSVLENFESILLYSNTTAGFIPVLIQI